MPAKWSGIQQKFQGGEILYNNDFKSDDTKIQGFVQEWNTSGDLKSFLESSKKISEIQNDIKNYKMTPITIKQFNGYLVNYEMTTSPKESYKAYEYFLKDKDKFIRFSFFVKSDNFKENMITIFETIVETMNYKE